MLLTQYETRGKDQKPRNPEYQRRHEEPYRCTKQGFLNTEYKSYLPTLKFYGLIKMDLKQEMGSGDLYWTDKAQDTNIWRAVVNTAMNLRFLQNLGRFNS